MTPNAIVLWIFLVWMPMDEGVTIGDGFAVYQIREECERIRAGYDARQHGHGAVVSPKCYGFAAPKGWPRWPR